MTAPTFPTRSFISESTERAQREKRRIDGPRPTADGTRGRGSKSRHCAREIALSAAGIPAEREPSYSNLIAWMVGQDWHNRIQALLVREFDARLEVPVSYRPTFDYSGNVDAVVDFNPETGERRTNLVTVEIKSMKQYAFTAALGQDQWGKESKKHIAGPKIEHITQAASYANAPQLLSDYLWMIYSDKNSGAIAEWILPMDEPLEHIDGSPTPRALAITEVKRQQFIFIELDKGRIPRRSIPGEGPIDDVPDPGSKDGPFLCRVCDYNELCRRLGKEPCSVDVLEEASRPLYQTNVSASGEELW